MRGAHRGDACQAAAPASRLLIALPPMASTHQRWLMALFATGGIPPAKVVPK